MSIGNDYWPAKVETMRRIEAQLQAKIAEQAETIERLQLQIATCAQDSVACWQEERERLRAAEVTRALEAVEAEETIKRLRAALEEVAGLDCSRYTKHLDAQKPCSCVSCNARKALRGAVEPSDAQ